MLNRNSQLPQLHGRVWGLFSALNDSCSSKSLAVQHHSATLCIISFMPLLCSSTRRIILAPLAHTHTHRHSRTPMTKNDNSLIHPLSISHFYDEPNRIPSHRLSFNVLPFMVIQLIHILVLSLSPSHGVCMCAFVSICRTIDVWFVRVARRWHCVSGKRRKAINIVLLVCVRGEHIAAWWRGRWCSSVSGSVEFNEIGPPNALRTNERKIVWLCEAQVVIKHLIIIMWFH